jgi:tetratricopeptide (TPR) repeat protein
MVTALRRDRFGVIGTDIKDGSDFFKCDQPSLYDGIVANPPYEWPNGSAQQFIERSLELTKPFGGVPKLAAAFTNRGNAYRAKGDNDRAIAHYSEVILDPKFAIAFNNRGNAYRAKGDYDRAIADYDEAIRLDPKVAGAFTNRSLAYFAKGDHDRAIADYSEAIQLDPKHAAAFTGRGFACRCSRCPDA